jgi:hypothetical protein
MVPSEVLLKSFPMNGHVSRSVRNISAENIIGLRGAKLANLKSPSRLRHSNH